MLRRSLQREQQPAIANGPPRQHHAASDRPCVAPHPLLSERRRHHHGDDLHGAIAVIEIAVIENALTDVDRLAAAKLRLLREIDLEIPENGLGAESVHVSLIAIVVDGKIHGKSIEE